MNDSPWNCDYAVGASGSVALGAHTGTDFEIGDVVSLRGQPQLMTVESYCGECGSVSVVWFAGNEDDGWTLERDSFDEDMLVNLDDDD